MVNLRGQRRSRGEPLARIGLSYVDAGPLLKWVLESGGGHAIDLKPTYLYA